MFILLYAVDRCGYTPDGIRLSPVAFEKAQLVPVSCTQRKGDSKCTVQTCLT